MRILQNMWYCVFWCQIHSHLVVLRLINDISFRYIAVSSPLSFYSCFWCLPPLLLASARWINVYLIRPVHWLPLFRFLIITRIHISIRALFTSGDVLTLHTTTPTVFASSIIVHIYSFMSYKLLYNIRSILKPRFNLRRSVFIPFRTKIGLFHFLALSFCKLLIKYSNIYTYVYIIKIKTVKRIEPSNSIQ